MKKLNQQGEYVAATVAGIVTTAIVVFLLIIGVRAFVNWNNNRNHTLGRGDAPTGSVNKDARKIFELPDRFSNIAMFCDEYGNAVYVSTKSDDSRAMFALKDGCEAAQAVKVIQ